jgi:hypothetical protein
MTDYTYAQAETDHVASIAQDHDGALSSAPTVSENAAPSRSGTKDFADSLLTRAHNVMSELQDVLQQETEALKISDLRAALILQDKKIELTQRYEQIVQQAQNHQALMKASQSPMKAEIAALEASFKSTAEENKSALTTGKKSLERLVEKMLETVRKVVGQNQHSAYNASGSMSGNTTRSMPINVDQTF